MVLADMQRQMLQRSLINKRISGAGIWYLYHLPAEARRTQSEDGSYIGKSPAGLVDLKAGVRFLKINDKGNGR